MVRVAVTRNGAIGSAIWRIWIGKKNDNIYIAPRNIGGSAKGTLHENRYCHFGITDQETKRLGLPDRPMLETWTRAEGPADGATKAMSILIAHEFLSPREAPSADVISIDDPGSAKAISLDLYFSRAVPGLFRLSPSQRELGHVALRGGEHFFVVSDVVAIRCARLCSKKSGCIHRNQLSPDADRTGI